MFFFDLATPSGVERDDLGVTFPGVEAAYMDACRAALEISVDMLRERQDPANHRFEVRDEGAALVLEVPFAEVLQPRRRTAAPHLMHRQIEVTLGHSRRLRAEVQAELVLARGALEMAQETLRRPRFNSPMGRVQASAGVGWVVKQFASGTDEVRPSVPIADLGERES